jgi:predicted KAP-like P-loop ATPase
MSPLNDRITDRPLINPEQDDFQRAEFAKRLAHTLLAPSHTSSIVVGLYGKWGEGKSTVLNFIEHELQKTTPKSIVIHLNPWRFPDESQLLLDFFKQLTTALGQNLHNSFEKVVEAVTKYLPPLLPTFSFGVASTDPGKGLQAIGNVAQPSLEELHQRVDQAIADSGKRIVIIIDDIDRLEKMQIHAVFRLVKLTANFRQTAYLLAFDDIMVARAIGEMFAPGADAKSPDTLSAGQNFLEKIIQIPLRLPRARQSDLLTYCISRIQEVFIDNSIELDNEGQQGSGANKNQQRLGDLLRRGILPRLTTPRLAIRYANTVRFSLPLLRGEVNMVDLMLIEALNVFYPELHQFIGTRQDEFAGSVLDAPQVISLNLQTANEEPDLEKNLLDLFSKHNYSADSVVGARALLCALFPRVAKLYSSWPAFEDSRNASTEAELNRLQAVAAPDYFSRYFSYSVASGDVTDREYAAFLQSPAENQLITLRDFANRLGVSVALQRLEYRVPDLASKQCQTLFSTILQSYDLYKPDHNWNTFGLGEITQATRLLLKLLTRVDDSAERADIIRNLIASGGNFELAYEFDQQLQMLYQKENKLDVFGQSVQPVQFFTPEIWGSLLSEIPRLLLERALSEAENRPLYQTHPTRASKLLTIIWPQHSDISPGPADYVLRFLEQNPNDITDLLKVCSSRASHGNSPFYWTGLSHEQFDRLREVFGKRLYTLIRTQLGDEIVERVDFQDFDEPTPLQRLRQFVYFFENRLSTNTSQ